MRARQSLREKLLQTSSRVGRSQAFQTSPFPRHPAGSLFFRAARDGLSNCRSCLFCESGPHNLADALASVGDWLGLLNPDEPPVEAPAPWHDSERLQEVLFCISSYHREDQLKKYSL
jgi:hypothetical protein